MGLGLKPLNEALDEILARDPKPTLEELSKLMLKYLKKIDDTPAFLRSLADYIEAQPKVVTLDAKSIGYFIQQAWLETQGVK